jgi:hypothetical protein
MKLLKDLWLFCKAWRIASVKIVDDKLSPYRPEARHLMVVQQTRLALIDAGHEVEDLTGCIIHAAVALCYRFKKL